MNLKEAKEKGEMDQFVKEHDAKFPPADKKRFQKLIKTVALGTAKPKRGTSKKRPHAD
jgi:hypothetical protein